MDGKMDVWKNSSPFIILYWVKCNKGKLLAKNAIVLFYVSLMIRSKKYTACL